MKKFAQGGNAARPGPVGVRPALPLRLHRPWGNRAVGAAGGVAGGGRIGPRRERRRRRPHGVANLPQIGAKSIAPGRRNRAAPRRLGPCKSARRRRSPGRRGGPAGWPAAPRRTPGQVLRQRSGEDRGAPPGAAPGAPAARRSRAPRGSGRCAPRAPGWPGDSPSNAPRARPCKALRGFERPAAGRGFRSRRTRRSRAAVSEGPVAGGLTQRPDSCSGTPGG